MDDDFGLTLRGRKSDRKGDEKGGEQGEQGEQGNRKEERQEISSSNQLYKSENLPVVKEEGEGEEEEEGRKDMKNAFQDQQEKTVSIPNAIVMDERNQGNTNSNPLSVSETKHSIVMQNYLDSLSRVVENTTYWDNDDEEFSDMEEAMMMPNPEYEPYIQMEPVPGKDDEIPFQQGEIRQLADDYY